MVDGGIRLFNTAKRFAGMPLLTAGLLAGRFAQAADPRWLLQPVAGRWLAAVAAVQPETALQFTDACQKRLSLADKKLDLRLQGGNGRLVAIYGRCWVCDRAGRLWTVSQTPLDSDLAVTCQAIILEGDLGCNPFCNRGKTAGTE